MKKILLSLMCLIGIIATANAQTENLISNSDFEEWADGKPTDWATLATSTATIEQNADAHSGSSSVAVMGDKKNTRFASKSYTLAAGTYTMSAYVKQNGEDAGHYRLGYVKLENGKVVNSQKDYIYGDAAAAAPAEWTNTTFKFTLEQETELALIIMNNKNGNGASFLIDDFTLAKGDATEGGNEEDGDTETPDETPTETSTIAEVIAAGEGNAKTQGTIVATYDRGFLLSDGTGYILVYIGSNKGYAAGDVVTVSGATNIYGGLLQFGNTPTVEKTGTATVDTPTVTTMDAAAMDAYLKEPTIKYIEYTGTLNINGYYYNVNIEGTTTAIGSISYPQDGIVSDNLNGKTIKVTGYAIGVSSGKYVNTMAVKVEEVELGGNTPDETPTETSTIAEVIAAGEGDAKTQGTIVATYERGFLLSDGTGYILVYLGSNKGDAVGDVVTVSGTTNIYGGLLQFGNTPTVEKTGTATVKHPDVTIIEGADLDSYLEEPAIEYVQYTGKLNINGNYYNVSVDGAATATGSIQYPQSGTVTAKSGDIVQVTGYIIGISSNKYVNTMATKVETIESSEPVETKEYTVTEALAAYVEGEQIPAIITGYIVGSIEGQSVAEGAIFGDSTSVTTNLLIAYSADETNADNCIPVQLPSGAVRKALNLCDNPTNYKKEVKLTGSLEKYFGVAGLKSVSAYEFTGNTGIENITGEENGKKVIFDLTGRRIENISRPGIYIVNGKKMLVK
ncbi:MAG: carbohydrate binding domain-containing protein [Bacteroidaceae bacterium]|nr:carbohydrate binding domain-containing protein [Bacteroidaceae bacterium]